MAPRSVNTKQMSLTHSRMIVAEALTASIAEDPRLLIRKMSRLDKRARKANTNVVISRNIT